MALVIDDDDDDAASTLSSERILNTYPQCSFLDIKQRKTMRATIFWNVWPVGLLGEYMTTRQKRSGEPLTLQASVINISTEKRI
jgi:hypothetical protein